MWKGVVFGFLVVITVLVLYFTVFSKAMPNMEDEGEELSPEEM